MMRRRQVLTLFGSLSLSLLAGCQGDFPPHREISIGAISAERVNSGWRLHLTVENDNTIGDDEANFHDVSVLVYSRERQEVGSQEIGELKNDRDVNDGISVVIDTQAFPYIVTFDAEESPCDENTSIMVARFDGVNDGEYVWATEFRECDEGLPPDVETVQTPPVN